jgi:surface antigen
MHQILTIVVVIFALCAPAQAMNLTFMKDTPITRLKADEVKAFRAFIEQTLSNGAEGATVEWSAPQTKFTSKVTPAAPFSDGALECRRAAIESAADDRQSKGTYTFCRKPKGEWSIRNPSRGAKPAG